MGKNSIDLHPPQYFTQNSQNLLQYAIHHVLGIAWTDGITVYITKLEIVRADNAATAISLPHHTAATLNMLPSKHVTMGDFRGVIGLAWNNNQMNAYLAVVEEGYGVSIYQVAGNLHEMNSDATDTKWVCVRQISTTETENMAQGCIWNPKYNMLCLLFNTKARIYFEDKEDGKLFYQVKAVHENRLTNLSCACWMKEGLKLIIADKTTIHIYKWKNEEHLTSLPNEKKQPQPIMMSYNMPQTMCHIRGVDAIMDNALVCTVENIRSNDTTKCQMPGTMYKLHIVPTAGPAGDKREEIQEVSSSTVHYVYRPNVVLYDEGIHVVLSADMASSRVSLLRLTPDHATTVQQLHPLDVSMPGEKVSVRGVCSLGRGVLLLLVATVDPMDTGPTPAFSKLTLSLHLVNTAAHMTVYPQDVEPPARSTHHPPQPKATNNATAKLAAAPQQPIAATGAVPEQQHQQKHVFAYTDVRYKDKGGVPPEAIQTAHLPRRTSDPSAVPPPPPPAAAATGVGDWYDAASKTSLAGGDARRLPEMESARSSSGITAASTPYTSMESAKWISVQGPSHTGQRTEMFLLDDFRLKYSAVAEVFGLRNMRMQLQGGGRVGKWCYVSPNEQGYIPLTFCHQSTVCINGDPVPAPPVPPAAPPTAVPPLYPPAPGAQRPGFPTPSHDQPPITAPNSVINTSGPPHLHNSRAGNKPPPMYGQGRGYGQHNARW